MTTLKVNKKDGTIEAFDISKIDGAILKASSRANINLTEEDLELINDYVYDYFSDSPFYKYHVSTKTIHLAVIQCVRRAGFDEVADSYQEFRDYKNTYAKAFEDIKSQADDVLFLGDRENANFDSSLVSTKGSLIKGYLTKELYKQFYLSKEEKELTKRGDIYIHDLRDMLLRSFNCCLFRMDTVLKDGFEMSNVTYTEPKSVLTALQVIGDITLVASAQQFGGFTIAEIDKVLYPYCVKTYDKALRDYMDIFDGSNDTINCNPNKMFEYAKKILLRELEQGFQSLELKLNTVPSSRGDFAFTTITFGQWDYEDMSEFSRDIYRMIGETILKVRMKGHGDKQVVFPKLVYLYDEKQFNEDAYSRKLFEVAVECSSKCLYPDWLSLRGNPDHNVVADTFINHGVITSPMGCRAYLTPWKDPITGKYVAKGRCNIGAVSLNLPLIYARSKKENRDFYEVLLECLQVTRGFLRKRYEILRNTKAGTNPLAFCQGGLYGGFKDPDDDIGDLVNYMTASFGITALNELVILMTNGKHNLNSKEGRETAKEVVSFIKKVVDGYKNLDGYMYALYGTPAESLCGTQAVQYAKYTGDTQFGDYFTNSFHLHVSEDITPFEKQDGEEELFHMINGGHIQYVRIDNPENISAVKAVILRGMHKGFYQGVNFDAVYCNNCGEHSTNATHKCPHCGSENISVISRVCGYLGYTNVNGKSRMNDAKLAEIKDRKSM